MTTTPSTTTPTLLEAVMRFSRAIRATGHRFDRLEPVIKRTDAALLRYLVRHGDARAGDIAAEYNVDASVVSRQMGCLVARGQVERRTDPVDARASLLAITEFGRAQLAEFDQLYGSYLDGRFADWSDERLAETAAVLDAVASRLLYNADQDERAEQDEQGATSAEGNA